MRTTHHRHLSRGLPKQYILGEYNLTLRESYSYKSIHTIHEGYFSFILGKVCFLLLDKIIFILIINITSISLYIIHKHVSLVHLKIEKLFLRIQYNFYKSRHPKRYAYIIFNVLCTGDINARVCMRKH